MYAMHNSFVEGDNNGDGGASIVGLQLHQGHIHHATKSSPNELPVVERKVVVKPHACTRCSKSFSSTHQLAQHTRVHTGEKPFKCSFCERRFKQVSHVKQHTRLHTGERPYRCQEPTCGRTFVQLSNLQQHMSNHSKEPVKSKGLKFSCSVCGKGFASASSLSLHCEKKHNELIPAVAASALDKTNVRPRPYQCAICNKSYTTESALQIHSTKHTAGGRAQDVQTPGPSACPTPAPISPQAALGAPGFGCPSCSETFVSAEGLGEHIKVSHAHLMAGLPPPSMQYPPLPFCGPPGGANMHHWFANPYAVPPPGSPHHFLKSPPPSVPSDSQHRNS